MTQKTLLENLEQENFFEYSPKLENKLRIHPGLSPNDRISVTKIRGGFVAVFWAISGPFPDHFRAISGPFPGHIWAISGPLMYLHILAYISGTFPAHFRAISGT